MENNHKATKDCGFDRNASHAAGRYVCTCGYAEQLAITDQKGNPMTYWGGKEADSGLPPLVTRLCWAAADAIESLRRQVAELKDQLKLAELWRVGYEQAKAENAALREEIRELNQMGFTHENAAAQKAALEDAERYQWFRSKRLWDADSFPWPKDFEYPEPCLWDDGEMLDAAIDAARKK